MTHILEGSPTRGITSDLLQFPQTKELTEQFPGKVIVIPETSTLYHGSKSLRDLLNRNRFDYRVSANEGAFYFTDLPAIYTNCQVSVNHDLVMFWYGELSEEEITRLNAAGNGNLWAGGMNMGFDGRIFPNPDAFVKTEGGRDAIEIIVFPKGLNKLGKITAYPPGSEKHLYKYLRYSSI